jgi:hypothetical protein
MDLRSVLMKRRPVLFATLSALLALLVLAACAPLSLNGPFSAGAQPEATPTECGCSAEGPRAKTPGAVAPTVALPAVGATPAGPAAVEDMQAYRGQWQAYTVTLPGDPRREVSFEFPAAYSGTAFGFCAPREAAATAADALLRVDLGSRTTLAVSAASGGLNAAADALRAEPARSADTFDAPQELTIAGAPALKLPYRMGGAGRYGEVTLFEKDGLLFRVEAGVPSACDVPAIDLRELDAYQRLLESIQIN